MIVTLLLDNPPGKRYRLYHAYAYVLVEHALAHCIEWFASLPTRLKISPPPWDCATDQDGGGIVDLLGDVEKSRHGAPGRQ